MKFLNTTSGQIYRTTNEAQAAQARGETLAQVSDQIAAAIGRGLAMNRAQAREQQFKRGKAPTPIGKHRTGVKTNHGPYLEPAKEEINGE